MQHFFIVSVVQYGIERRSSDAFGLHRPIPDDPGKLIPKRVGLLGLVAQCIRRPPCYCKGGPEKNLTIGVRMRTLREIALDIASDWKVIKNAGARDALACMKEMGKVTERFGADPNGYSIIGTFLSSSVGWRGEVARRIKRELREMSGHPRL